MSHNVYKLRVVILQKMILSTNVSWLNLNVFFFNFQFKSSVSLKNV